MQMKREEPAPREYGVATAGIGIVQLLDLLENDVKKHIVSLTSNEVDSLLKEAQQRLNETNKLSKADYDNWLKYRNVGLLIVPSKGGHRTADRV